jgi:hypothetical protein
MVVEVKARVILPVQRALPPGGRDYPLAEAVVQKKPVLNRGPQTRKLDGRPRIITPVTIMRLVGSSRCRKTESMWDRSCLGIYLAPSDTDDLILLTAWLPSPQNPARSKTA